MIGFIGSDCGTMIEVWPVFGSDNGIPNAAQFRFKKVLPEKYCGEFGVGVNGFTVWVMWDISTYPVSFGTFGRQIKTISRDVLQWWKKR